MDQELSDLINAEKIIEVDSEKVLEVHVLMDIANSISVLKSGLEQLVPGKNLSDYKVWLRNDEILDQSYTLAECCIASIEGIIEIIVQILDVKKQIIIVDVIQPSEETIQKTKKREPEPNIEMNDTTHVASGNNNSHDNEFGMSPRKRPANYIRIEEIKSSRNGNPILWKFLLELLTDNKHCHIIQWIENDGKFKIVDPNAVAKVWGELKGKPNMSYESLARALRYYYQKEHLLTKVGCKLYEYKFNFDIKTELGYEPQQLNDLANGSAKQPCPQQYLENDFFDINDDTTDLSY